MSQASQLRIAEGSPLTTIVGQNFGKRVLCSNQALPVYNELAHLADKGNYWAWLVVKSIQGLTSGRLNIDNLYIQKENSLAYGPGVFYLILPGVRATLQARDDGDYELRGLKADLNYVQQQEDKQKPGLWQIHKEVDRKATFQSNGSIIKKEFRSVVIADRSPDDPAKIAKAVRNDLTKLNTTIKQMVGSFGFDLHYTPGEKHIDGLKPAHQALVGTDSRNITESATLLANTMYNARDIEGVLWFADWGGSAVLTRALQILHNEKNITLKKHALYLNRPTSNSATAINLAKGLELNLAGNGGKSSGLHKREVLSNHLVADITLSGTDKAAAFCVSAGGAVFGLAQIAPTTASAIGLAGAMYFIRNAVSAGAQQFSGKKYR
jgi:hypothetical protein